MRKEMIDILVCPFDKQDLNLAIYAQDLENNIIEGLFTCPHCERYFPIIQGIPIMSPDEYRQTQLEAPILKRWEKQLEGKQVDGFTLKAKEIIELK